MTITSPDLRNLARRFVDDVINARDLDGTLVDLVAVDGIRRGTAQVAHTTCSSGAIAAICSPAASSARSSS